MRGIASEGMLISAGELALEAGMVRRRHHAARPRPAARARTSSSCSVSADPVLDVDVTPNRVDAISMLGLARELAAAFERAAARAAD